VGPLRERAPLLADLFAEMEGAARRQLEHEGFAPDGQRMARSLDLRYRGQAFELAVPVGGGAFALDAIEDAFHRQHLGAYGHANREAMIYPLFAPGADGPPPAASTPPPPGRDDDLFIFPVVRAHWGDVGGMSPGSLSGRATEIFQEGLRIPPIKIFDRRAALRAARPRVRVTAGRGLQTERGRALRLDAATAGALGVAAGAVVELVNPRGAPLRAWVAGILPGNGRRAEVAAVALRMLALADGAEVEVRAVHSGVLGAARASGGES
jgi:hypothetical protein